VKQKTPLSISLNVERYRTLKDQVLMHVLEEFLNKKKQSQHLFSGWPLEQSFWRPTTLALLLQPEVLEGPTLLMFTLYVNKIIIKVDQALR